MPTSSNARNKRIDDEKIRAAQDLIRARHHWKVNFDQYGWNSQEEKIAFEQLELAMKKFKYWQAR